MTRLSPSLLAIAFAACMPCQLGAQSNLEATLSETIKSAPKQFGTVSDVDKKTIIREVASLLSRHLTFRRDGVCSSNFKAPSGLQTCEWRDLHISMLVTMPLTETEKAAGIEKRIQAILKFDKARILNSRTGEWSRWGPKGHPLFPPAITYEWKGGRVTANAGYHIDKFIPGPAISQGKGFQPTTAADNNAAPANPAVPDGVEGDGFIKPAAGAGGLPPGMQRNK